MENSNVPEIRFKGFGEDWERRKLGEVVEKLKSYPLSRDVESENATGYRYIHYGDIHKQRADIITDDEQLPSIKAGDYVPLQRGDIIVADASEDYTGIAEPSVIIYEPVEKIIAGLHTISMRPIEADSLYLYYLLHTQHFKKFGGETGTGLKVFGISFNNLTKYETSYPDKSEQTAIGNFFRTLDDTIALHKRKLDGLKELKNGYLQQMFPQAGECVPQIRFAGFSEPWEERKLGEISIKITEKNKRNEYCETLTNSAERGIISQRDFFDKDISNTKNLGGYYIVQPDDFVYNPRISNFAPVGPIKRNLLGRTGVMSPLYYVFRIVNGDPTFIEKYFESVYWHDFMILNGDNGVRSDRFNIKDSIFEEMPIPFPKISEQTAIGNFFRNLDEQITAQQTKLNKLKQLKAAYLHKMFV